MCFCWEYLTTETTTIKFHFLFNHYFCTVLEHSLTSTIPKAAKVKGWVSLRLLHTQSQYDYVCSQSHCGKPAQRNGFC